MRAAASYTKLVHWAVAVAMTVGIVAPLRAATEDIPGPGEFFGRQIGEAGVLIEHADILRYYELLAERSDRVQLHQLGETTEGRPFYYALISSPANLARIDALLAENDKLYDPRGLSEAEAERIIGAGKAFVIVNGQIHSTEVGASQGGILLAHRLASAEDEEVLDILDNVVIAHVPVHNPDGQEMVTQWLDEQRGTPYENSAPPFLYHKYTGHDNNRDWYMFSQIETRLSIVMQNKFHPQFTLDQHQMGSNGSRIFVPPFEDPWEPNVDSALIASNNMIGTFMGQYLTARGYRGVEWKQRYDAWTPARAYHHSHGGVRILTEVASADYADDLHIDPTAIDATYRERHWYFPMPWPGGEWTFAEVVDYHYTAAMAALRAAADLRPHLLRGMLAAQRRSVQPEPGAPYAWVFPDDQSDPAVMARLLEVLRIADVDVQQAAHAFEAGGRSYGAGSMIVPMAQPAGRFANSILERQQYPQLFLYEGGPLDPPYDVTAQTLPLLMNVRADAVAEPFEVEAVSVDKPQPPAGKIVATGDGSAIAYAIDGRINGGFSLAASMAGHSLLRATEPFVAAGRDWVAGSWLFVPQKGAAGVADTQQFSELVVEHHITAYGLSALPDVASGWIAPPRVAIYQSYVPSMSEGWTRFMLDEYGIPYDIVHDRDVRAGDLDAYGVILLPDGTVRAIVDGRSTDATQGRGGRVPPSPAEFAGGIGEEGVAALRAYVRGGGTLFTWANSTGVATRYFAGPEDLGAGLPRTEFNIPGSLLRVDVDTEHWLAYGLEPETAIFFWRSPFWSPVADEMTTVARYPAADLLLSGWIQGEETLAGKAALVELHDGDGRVVMVGFSPEYRAQAHQTFKVLFNAIFRPRVESE